MFDSYARPEPMLGLSSNGFTSTIVKVPGFDAKGLAGQRKHEVWLSRRTWSASSEALLRDNAQ
jgi:hypothetical protein